MVEANEAVWTTLFAQYRSLFGHDVGPVFYGLPEQLIEALSKEAPGLLTKSELDFELELADALKDRYSIGIDQGRMIKSSLFEDRQPVTVSKEDFDALGWADFGLSYERINEQLAEGEARSVLFHGQLVAYAGWLVTNAQFLGEVALLQERQKDLLRSLSDEAAGSAVREEMNRFLAKWQLAGMSSWDLPEPQGPNLGGIDFPAATQRGAATVKLELPLTTRLPARFPIRDLISEIRREEALPHLAEWQEILSTERSAGLGIERFGRILHIRFFRDIVLASRYESRLSATVEAQDRAFGGYLGLSPESIKKLRQQANRRRRQPMAS